MVRKEHVPAAWEYQFQEESDWRRLLGVDVAVPELPNTWAGALEHLRANRLFPAYLPDLGLYELIDMHKDDEPAHAADAMLADMTQVFPGLTESRRDQRFLRRHLGLSQQDYALGPYPQGEWVLTTDTPVAMGVGIPLTRYLNRKNTKYHEHIPGAEHAVELYDEVLSTLLPTHISPKSIPSAPTAMEYFLLRRRGLITPIDGYEWTSTKLLSPSKDPNHKSFHEGAPREGRTFHFNYLCIDPQGQLAVEQGSHAYFNQEREDADDPFQTPMHLRPLIRNRDES